MSSIFKALKKLESEQGRTSGMPSLPSVLLNDPPAPQRRVHPAILVCVGLAVGATLGLAGLMLIAQPDQQVKLPAVATPVPSASVPKAEPVADAAPVQVESTVRAAKEPNVAKTEALQKPAVKKPAAAPAPVTRQEKLALLPTEKTIEEVRFDREAVATVVKPVKQPAPVVPEPTLSLLVTEIYYQPEGQESMAVVNDLPVMEGTQIDEAVVKKILPDRILFLVQGGQVEIPLKSIP